MSGFPLSKYYYAKLAIYIALFVATAIVTIASFWCVRAKNDVLRRWIKWFKAALACFALSCLFVVCTEGLEVEWRKQMAQKQMMSAGFHYQFALAVVSYLSILFLRVSMSLTFICLISLGTAVAVSRGAASSPSRIFKFGSYGVAAAVGVLSFCNWAVYTSLLAYQWQHRNDDYDESVSYDSVEEAEREDWYFKRLYAMQRMDFVLLVIFAAFALVALARAILVCIRTRKLSTDTNAPVLYLLGSCLFFALQTVERMSQAVYHRTYNIDPFSWRQWNEAQLYASVVLGYWPLLLTFILLLILAWHKERGLWSGGEGEIGYRAEGAEESPGGTASKYF